MTRVVYICRGFGNQQPYWITDCIEESDRPNLNDGVIFNADDVGRPLGVIVAIYRWPYWTNLDYEARIEVPTGHVEDQTTYEAWLRQRGFRQVEDHQYAELFGMPELAVRFPKPGWR